MSPKMQSKWEAVRPAWYARLGAGKIAGSDVPLGKCASKSMQPAVPLSQQDASSQQGQSGRRVDGQTGSGCSGAQAVTGTAAPSSLWPAVNRLVGGQAVGGQAVIDGGQAARERSRVLMRVGAGADSSAASTRAVFLGERAGRRLEPAGSASEPSWGCSAAAGRVAGRPRPRRCLPAVAGVVAAAAACSSCSCVTVAGCPSSSVAVPGVAADRVLRPLRGAVRGVRGVRAPTSDGAPALSLAVEMTPLAGGSGRKQEVVRL